MGGPSQAQTQQQNIAAQQNQEGLALEQQSLNLQQQGLNEEQPAINYYTALTSGNPNLALSAAAPQVSQISKSANTAQQQIADTIAPGAAQQIAQGQVIQGANTQLANTLNTTETSAFDKLANLGAGIGAFSLQDLGAGLGSVQSSASNYGQVSQEQNAQKASTLGLLGGLAGTGASFFPTYSDRRLKGNVVFIGRIGPVNIYEFKFIGQSHREIGVIAQEVHAIYPQVVHVGGEDPAVDPWTVDYWALKRIIGQFYSGRVFGKAA